MKLLSLLPFVLGYSYKTHHFLGELMDKYFIKYEPTVYQQIKLDLDANDIASISSWADKIKYKNPWTKKLHYIDILECKKEKYSQEDVNKYCEKGKCIVNVIIDYHSQISDKKCSIIDKNNLERYELMRFLVHYIQDFNQPMHLLGYSKGGNGMKIIVNYKNKNISTNAHFLWDTLVPEHYTKYYFNKLQVRVNDTLETVQEIVYRILNENMKIACPSYPKENYIILEKYFSENNLHKLFDNYSQLFVVLFRRLYIQ